MIGIIGGLGKGGEKSHFGHDSSLMVPHWTVNLSPLPPAAGNRTDRAPNHDVRLPVSY
jgi:hypothetical protein